MPELPEVEVIRRGLAPVLVGRRFLAVQVGDKRLRQQSSPQDLRRWLLGRRLESLRRRGKYLRVPPGRRRHPAHPSGHDRPSAGGTSPLPSPAPRSPGVSDGRRAGPVFPGYPALRPGPGLSPRGGPPAPGPGGGRAVFPESDPGLAGRAGPGPVPPHQEFPPGRPHPGRHRQHLCL